MQKKKNAYKLLYIEDDIEVRKNYVAYLSRFFEYVYEASDTQEAWSVYNLKKPSILIIDIDLAGESGIDFLQKIRQKDYTTKAIMLTAKSDVQTLLLASELKLSKYLVKPVSRQELKDALELAIEEIEAYNIIPTKIVKMKEDYIWDMEHRVLKKAQILQELTKKEQELLALLFSNLQKTFSSEDIIFELWYDALNPKESALKTLIKGVRKKLPKGTIKNTFGVGYKLEF